MRENPWIDPRIIDDMLSHSRLAERSQQVLRYYIRLYADYLESNCIPFEMADAEDIACFYDSLQSKYSPSSARFALRSAKRIHRWRDVTPEEKVGLDIALPSRKAGNGVRKLLTLSQVKAIRDACETTRNLAIICLLTEVALRPCELSNIKIGDIKFVDKFAVMTIGESPSRPKSVARIPTYATAVLKKYLSERPEATADEALFVSESTRSMGKPLAARSIREIIQITFKKADVPGTAGNYDLRKTAIALARNEGADDKELMNFARLRCLGAIDDADNLYRYASDGAQERLSRLLSDPNSGKLTSVLSVSDIRVMIEDFEDEKLVKVTLDDSGKLVIEPY